MNRSLVCALLPGLSMAGPAAGHARLWQKPARCDRDGDLTTRHMDYEPFDFPAVHITKISDYRIHEQEAMGDRLPYMSSNGWSRFLR